MNTNHKKILKNLLIILCPVLAIRYALGLGAVSVEELGLWDIAISVGAMMSLLIYLFKDKKG